MSAGPGPVPVIIDTDMFSDADDVGALAVAFGLQLEGEARVAAVTVNTRTSRPAVSDNSWRCVAAIAQFYGAGEVPIGSDTPLHGTETNTVDFAGPCADLASPSTPAPDAAVPVLRRALAGQPDHSTVVVGIGYLENLAALLASPPDGISPLGGEQLVAQKVRCLVAMAGRYPSGSGETNLVGNVAAARAVATDWPTPVVWSGTEVGDAVHTGNTISGVHPASSPVRVAYEAFVRPGNWIYSYDLTAVYHAIRPADPLLAEVGPGFNTVSSTGANTFTVGSGSHYYLTTPDPATLDNAIEALLDVLPAATPDTTAPVITGVTVSAVSATGATVAWSTDEPADSQAEYGTSPAFGSVTTRDGKLATGHSQPLTGLLPGTTYYLRVKSADAAGNLAASPTVTFTTTASPAPVGPSDDFSGAALDPDRWLVTRDESAVGVAGGQLQISHPAGDWTVGAVQSATRFDQSGRAVQVQLLRAANNGRGGSTYGETSVIIRLDSTRYVEFWIAGGAITAWSHSGTGAVNLTPSWPAYSPAAMRWLRFRESGGRLYWEVSAGIEAPGQWTVLASQPDPFDLHSVLLQLVAGSNLAAVDPAVFDNVSTQ